MVGLTEHGDSKWSGQVQEDCSTQLVEVHSSTGGLQTS